MNDEYEEIRVVLIDLLYEVPIMQQGDGRSQILVELKRKCRGLNISQGATDMIYCANIIDAVLNTPGRLHELASTLRWLEGSPQAEAFAKKVNHVLPSHFLTLRERMELIAELGAFVRAEELESYYHIVTEEITAAPFGSLDNLARELEEKSPPGPGDHWLIRLCVAVEQRRSADAAAVAVATKWADRLAEALDANAPDIGRRDAATARANLERLRTSGKVLAAADPRNCTLVLQLEPSGPRPDHYLFSAWLYLDGVLTERVYANDEPMPLDQVQQTLIGVLDDLLLRLGEADTPPGLGLEFILPRALLLRDPFGDWQIRQEDYRRLGVLYPIVVRDLYRLSDPVALMACKQKWEQAMQDGGCPVHDLSLWVTCADECRPGQFYPRLVREELVSLGLTFRPGDGAHPFDISEALDAGIPIAVWPRRCDHSSTPLRTTVNGTFKDELMQRLRGKILRELPRIVLDMRRQDADSGIAGAGLTLLWDDPTRKPAPDNYTLAAPGPWEGH